MSVMHLNLAVLNKIVTKARVITPYFTKNLYVSVNLSGIPLMLLSSVAIGIFLAFAYI